jgi:hypothetical protein
MADEVVKQLRKKARQARRAAAVPTVGGARADKYLVELGTQLEREADAIEKTGLPKES